MVLTNTEVLKAKPGPSPIKMADRRGLYLLITPTGSKLWRWKYRFLGKEKLMAIGAYPDVSLAQARDNVDRARQVLFEFFAQDAFTVVSIRLRVTRGGSSPR